MRETLTKLLALYNDHRATPNERKVAFEKAQRLADKYGIDLDSVNVDHRTREFDFKCNKNEIDIITHIIWHLCPREVMCYEVKNASGIFTRASLTNKEFVDCSVWIDYYLPHYRAFRKKIINNIANSFIVKHRLFPSCESDQKEQPPATADIYTILGLTRTADDIERPTKRLKEGSTTAIGEVSSC